MRKILFLVLCSMILDLCYPDEESPMAATLNPTNKAGARIAFLMNEKCKAGGVDNKKLVTAEDVESSKHECSDTIGFMPITKDKVQVFVTANKVSDISGIKLSYSEPDPSDPSDRSKRVETLVMSCDETGMSVGPDPSKIPLTVTTTKDILFLDKATPNNIVQCKSVYIESVKDKKTIADIFKADVEWILTIKNVDASKDEDRRGKSIDFQKLTDKLGCEPDVIITDLDARDVGDKDLKIDKLDLQEGAADGFAYRNKEKEYFTHTRVVNNKCPTGSLMTYSIVDNAKAAFNMEKMGFANTVECVGIEENGKKKWKYEITHPDAADPKEYVEPGKKIKVKCMRNKCRGCTLPIQGECLSDQHPCMLVSMEQHLPITPKNFLNCDDLNTDRDICKVLHVNGVSNTFIPKRLSCGNDAKFWYKKDDQEPAQEVKNITCASRFSAHLDKFIGNLISPLKDVTETKEVVNCPSGGCNCTDHVVNGVVVNQLALANKNNSGWIRIKSTNFNADKNTWSYFRKHADGIVREHALNKNSSILRCIANPNDVLKLRGVKETKLPNPDKAMVVVANLGVLALIVGITVPGVIFFVNAREKKREARKAAKKDKKKDEQSGDKKDSEGKKDEKKNEA